MPPSVNEGENAVDLDDDGDTSRDAVNDHPHPSRQAASSLHVDSDDIDSEDDAMANPTSKLPSCPVLQLSNNDQLLSI